MSNDDPRLHDDDRIDDEELVPEDDRVIGRAFRGSLAMIGVVVAIVAFGLYLTGRSEQAPAEQTLQSAGPEEVRPAAAPPSVTFKDVGGESGIDFVHVNGAEGDKLLPETMGSGAAFFDYDNDGDPDLFLVNSTAWPHSVPPSPVPTSALYRNDGSGAFEDVTRETGLDLTLYGVGVATGDYDGDGWIDLFISALGHNRLLRNDASRFHDVTVEAGVAGDADAWSTSSGFFDYDNDGDLDLLVCNYVRWSREIDFDLDFRLTGIGRAFGPPQSYEGSRAFLYRNEGDGTFSDVSASSGIRVDNPATGLPMAKSLALAPVDVDRDGHIDVLVANDTVQNFFFHNRGDGTFEQAAEFYGLAYDRDGNATGAMGVDAAHYRNDHNLGFAIGNFANEMTSIYVTQDDPSFFVDEAIGEGVGAISRRMLTFGLFLFDYDLDGRLDMLQANGHIEDEINKVDPSQQYRQPTQLFWNAGADQPQTFVPVEPDSTGDLSREIVGRGATYADIDADGDLDVALTQVAGRPLLLRNDQRTGHHWLRIKLDDDGPNRGAIGAWIELTAAGVTQRRQVMPTRSYLSQVELPVTFGLGTGDRFESIEITWPDGATQRVEGGPADRLLRITRSGIEAHP